MAVIADLPAGIAARFDRRQQPALERKLGSAFIGLGHGIDDRLARQHIAHGDIAVADDMACPAAILRTAVGRDPTEAIDHRDLAELMVGIVGLQLVDHVIRRVALRQQPERQRIVALVHEGLGHGGADIAAQAIAVEAHGDRVGRDADADLAALRTARKECEGHERLSPVNFWADALSVPRTERATSLALQRGVRKFVQILELALQETQELLRRQRQLPRGMRDRVDGRAVHQPIADRHGDQLARAQTVPGRQAREEGNAVIYLHEFDPQLDRIGLQRRRYMDTRGLAGDVDQDAAAGMLHRRRNRIGRAVGQRDARPAGERMMRRHHRDQGLAHLEHRLQLGLGRADRRRDRCRCGPRERRPPPGRNRRS